MLIRKLPSAATTGVGLVTILAARSHPAIHHRLRPNLARQAAKTTSSGEFYFSEYR
jgi:hypothetical protein